MRQSFLRLLLLNVVLIVAIAVYTLTLWEPSSLEYRQKQDWGYTWLAPQARLGLGVEAIDVPCALVGWPELEAQYPDPEPMEPYIIQVPGPEETMVNTTDWRRLVAEYMTWTMTWGEPPTSDLLLPPTYTWSKESRTRWSGEKPRLVIAGLGRGNFFLSMSNRDIESSLGGRFHGVDPKYDSDEHNPWTAVLTWKAANGSVVEVTREGLVGQLQSQFVSALVVSFDVPPIVTRVQTATVTCGLPDCVYHLKNISDPFTEIDDARVVLSGRVHLYEIRPTGHVFFDVGHRVPSPTEFAPAMLQSWVVWHLDLVGVDYIVLFVDGPNYHTHLVAELLRPWVEKGKVFLMPSILAIFGNQDQETTAMIHWLATRSEFVITLDYDEFMWFNSSDPTVNWWDAAQHCPKRTQVAWNSRIVEPVERPPDEMLMVKDLPPLQRLGEYARRVLPVAQSTYYGKRTKAMYRSDPTDRAVVALVHSVPKRHQCSVGRTDFVLLHLRAFGMYMPPRADGPLFPAADIFYDRFVSVFGPPDPSKPSPLSDSTSEP